MLVKEAPDLKGTLSNDNVIIRYRRNFDVITVFLLSILSWGRIFSLLQKHTRAHCEYVTCIWKNPCGVDLNDLGADEERK